MQTDGTPLSSGDFERIGQLHVESIDDSLPALLGSAYAADLYRFLARSERELLFVELTEERVESCCVVSLEPDSLQARIARATSFALGRSALIALRRPAFRQYLRGALRDALRSGAHSTRAPEITYIFTNRSGRGRGLGGILIDRVDTYLRNASFSSYFVKTLDVPSNRAIGFYERHGFVPIGRCQEAGRTFVEFEKPLNRPAAD